VTAIVLGGIVDLSNRTTEAPTDPKILKKPTFTRSSSAPAELLRRRVHPYEFLSSTYVRETINLAKEVVVVVDHSKFGRIVLINMTNL
jgi:DeoR/GlpR family transcriptional regulator of sugar metabolism